MNHTLVGGGRFLASSSSLRFLQNAACRGQSAVAQRGQQ